VYLTLLMGCAGDPPSPPPDVVLITIDTLRADHCSLYGYERPTTPFLDELAERATVFENASASSSWTAPSMASLFTSLPPRSHGVRTGFYRKGKVVNQDYLQDDFETLAEVLAGHGYRAFGVSTNAALTTRTGFAQGFDALTELWWEPAAVVNEHVLRLRAELEAADRYFLWVHYFDPHAEYVAQEPWFSEYEGSPPPATATGPEEATRREALEKLKVSIEKYDSEINYVDASIRKLVEALDLESSALLVITSDHGEAFLEHWTLSHGQSLFQEEIRIPLLLRLPDQRESRRIDAPVSLVDIYPTILDALSLEIPSGLAGTSLLPVIRDGRGPARAIVAELDRGTRSDHSLTWQQWKLYQRERPNPFVRLFDLRTDPGEREDLSATETERLRELTERWARWKATWPYVVAPRKVAPFGPEEQERLRALGYL
jgi:arylsulfatase A-like enzyme